MHETDKITAADFAEATLRHLQETNAQVFANVAWQAAEPKPERGIVIANQDNTRTILSRSAAHMALRRLHVPEQTW